MCHCGTLSITRQLFCPHHHSAEPERATTGVQGFTMGVLRRDAIIMVQDLVMKCFYVALLHDSRKERRFCFVYFLTTCVR